MTTVTTGIPDEAVEAATRAESEGFYIPWGAMSEAQRQAFRAARNGLAAALLRG